jgi:hypothetical protein
MALKTQNTTQTQTVAPVQTVDPNADYNAALAAGRATAAVETMTGAAFTPAQFNAMMARMAALEAALDARFAVRWSPWRHGAGWTIDRGVLASHG